MPTASFETRIPTIRPAPLARPYAPIYATAECRGSTGRTALLDAPLDRVVALAIGEFRIEVPADGLGDFLDRCRDEHASARLRRDFQAIAAMGLSNACFKRGACITSATLR